MKRNRRGAAATNAVPAGLIGWPAAIRPIRVDLRILDADRTKKTNPTKKSL